MIDFDREVFAPATAAVLNATPANGAAVLVVEDEPELAEILRYNLRKNGYEVLLAADGLSACRLASSRRPDLILLDVLLPDLSGWEICRLIRGHADEEIAATPIIMVTALGTLENRLKGFELGADAYLPKPYSVREVLVRAADLLKKRREVRALKSELASLRAGVDLQQDIQGMLFHELRNQLVVLGGFSSFLARKRDEIPAQQSAEYAEAICRSSRFLSTLAEELLLARHLHSGRLELPAEPIDPRKPIDDTLVLYRPLMDESGFELAVRESDTLSPVRGNYAAIRLILSLLLENALKYGGRGATLSAAADKEGVLISLKDRGEGIDPEEIERIFTKFYRGRNASQKARGTGLGLFFARTLAESMGGRLDVYSRPGAGSRFTVRLPLALLDS